MRTCLPGVGTPLSGVPGCGVCSSPCLWCPSHWWLALQISLVPDRISTLPTIFSVASDFLGYADVAVTLVYLLLAQLLCVKIHGSFKGGNCRGPGQAAPK